MLQFVVVLLGAKGELRAWSASVHASYDVACYRLRKVRWGVGETGETIEREGRSMRLNENAKKR